MIAELIGGPLDGLLVDPRGARMIVFARLRETPYWVESAADDLVDTSLFEQIVYHVLPLRAPGQAARALYAKPS